jgi:UDP-N-acetylglucosamine enolpyruvyl transferase
MRQLEVQWPTVLLVPGGTKEGQRKVTLKLNRHYQSGAEVSSRNLRHTSHRTSKISGR